MAQSVVKRVNIGFTGENLEHIAAIKKARKLQNDTAVIRFALELAAQDAEFGFIGFAAITNERAYRNLRALQSDVRDGSDGGEAIAEGLGVMAQSVARMPRQSE